MEGLAEMRTPQEWLEIYRNNKTDKLSAEYFVAVVKDAQSDAYNAGYAAGGRDADKLIIPGELEYFKGTSK